MAAAPTTIERSRERASSPQIEGGLVLATARLAVRIEYFPMLVRRRSAVQLWKIEVGAARSFARGPRGPPNEATARDETPRNIDRSAETPDMSLIVIIIILVLIFGGGGGYYAHGRYGGTGLGGVLGIVVIVLIALWLFGR
jgi:hypothetical protein